MLTYSFENREFKYLYDYLYQCIKTDKLNGKILADKKLQSKKNLPEN